MVSASGTPVGCGGAGGRCVCAGRCCLGPDEAAVFGFLITTPSIELGVTSYWSIVFVSSSSCFPL